MCTPTHCSPEYPTFSIARALNYVYYQRQIIERNLHAFPSLILHYSFPVLPLFWSLPFLGLRLAEGSWPCYKIERTSRGLGYGGPPTVPHSCCALVRKLGFSPITHGPSCSFYHLVKRGKLRTCSACPKCRFYS